MTLAQVEAKREEREAFNYTECCLALRWFPWANGFCGRTDFIRCASGLLDMTAPWFPKGEKVVIASIYKVWFCGQRPWKFFQVHQPAGARFGADASVGKEPFSFLFAWGLNGVKVTIAWGNPQVTQRLAIDLIRSASWRATNLVRFCENQSTLRFLALLDQSADKLILPLTGGISHLAEKFESWFRQIWLLGLRCSTGSSGRRRCAILGGGFGHFSTMLQKARISYRLPWKLLISWFVG